MTPKAMPYVGPRPRSERTRAKSKPAVGVETLEGRALLSYLVIPRGHKIVPVHVSNARLDEPLFSNGLAAKKAPGFYGLYTGPKLPQLNGVQASGFVSGSNLILRGVVDGPIVTKPATTADGAIYSFAIDRGGASNAGPFPGRPNIRFDAVVNVSVLPADITATVAATTPSNNQPGVKPTALASTAAVIQGDTVTVSVPLSDLPSNGHAYDQWNVNFFTQHPGQKPGPDAVASFTPEFTEFQIFVQPSNRA